MCQLSGMKVNGIKLAPWAEKEYRKEIRKERRGHFFGHVRGIFILLLIATASVYIHNHQVELQRLASAELGGLKKSPTTDSLRSNALRHEQEVNQASH